MRCSRGVLVVLAALALVGSTVATPVSPAPLDESPSVSASGEAASPDRADRQPSPESPDRPTRLAAAGPNLTADSTAIEVVVADDGTAEWTVQYRVRLDDQSTTERFERVEADVEANPLSYTGPFTEQMQEAADIASAETGRSMTVGNTSVHARTTADGFGVVTYRFTWEAFAAASDGRLRIGDALVGFFIGSEGTSLIVAWPAGYEVEQVSPEPDETHDRSVVWRGQREFGPNQPRVVVSGGFPVPVEGLAALAVGLVVVAAAWRLRRGGVAVPSPWPAGAAGDGSAAAGVDVPDELLSDSERVLELLERNGGRMKQQAVVEHLEWSETKTSQVVNGLKEDGEIEVYRIGRENVLSLPGEMDV